jgi:hypothetical protein
MLAIVCTVPTCCPSASKRTPTFWAPFVPMLWTVAVIVAVFRSSENAISDGDSVMSGRGRSHWSVLFRTW